LIDEAFGDFTLRKIDETPVVVLAGELDVSNVADFQRTLEAVSESDSLVIDMTQVEFLDSTALAALVRYRKASAARGTTIALVIVSPLVGRIFAITNFDRDFTIVPRLEDVPGLYPKA
jgi:anti-sigma B factor antagonist